MSIWTRISEALASLAAGEGLAAVFDRLKSPPQRSIAFTIAVIALGAKMAKADGRVTRDEVAAFREVFAIPEGEERNAARVFNLARQDVAGFQVYARRIARMFEHDRQTRIDLLEGLFHIAVADGEYHAAEDAFLAEVAAILGLDEMCFRSLRARFAPEAGPDPYAILGLAPGATLDDARAAWRAAVMECHPDRLAARGLPPEALRLAETRLRAINDAWNDIRRAA